MWQLVCALFYIGVLTTHIYYVLRREYRYKQAKKKFE